MNTDYRNLTAINDFRDPQEYLYNSDLVEFTQFGVRLKSQVASNIVAGATFTKDYFLNYQSDIFNSPYVFGSVSVQNERLALIGGVYNKQWTAQFKDKLGNLLPKGSIYFTYYPNYSNCPQTTQHIFTFGRIPDEDNKKNLIEIQHSSTGDFLFNLYDKAGNQTQTSVEKTIEYANTPIQFCLVYDSEVTYGNDIRVKFNLFMEGESVKKYDLDLESFHINKITEISLGNMIGSFKPNFAIKNLVVLNDSSLLSEDQYAVTEDCLFTLPETKYTTTPQKVEPLFQVDLEVLKSIVAETNNSDDVDRGFYVNFTFKVNNTEFFFDRQDLTWKQHVNPDQISDLGYMLAYKDQLLGNKEGVGFKCIPYLKTVKGANTPSIVSQTIKYDQFVPYVEHVPTAVVYGYVRDALGNFLKNAKILITPSRASVAETGNFILAEMTKTVRTGNNGYWDVQLPLSTNFVPELLYNFQVLFRDEVVFERANIKITREGTIKFEDLISGVAPDPIVPTPDPGSEDYPYPDNYIRGMFWQEIEDEEASNSDHDSSPTETQDFIIEGEG